MSRTRYIVLFQDNDGWVPFEGSWEATSANGAIRTALNAVEGGSPGGTLVAVPLRSWKPQPVKVETQQRLRIG